MLSPQNQTDAGRLALAVIIITIVVSIRELYISGNDRYCMIGILLLLIPILIPRLTAGKKRP
jgi:hypothetical protein